MPDDCFLYAAARFSGASSICWKAEWKRKVWRAMFCSRRPPNDAIGGEWVEEMHLRTSSTDGLLEHATRHSRAETFMLVLLFFGSCRWKARRIQFRSNSPVLTELQVEDSAVIVVFAWLCPYAREERCVNPIVITCPGPTWTQHFPIPQPTESHCFQTFVSLCNASRVNPTLLIVKRLVSVVRTALKSCKIVTRESSKIIHLVIFYHPKIFFLKFSLSTSSPSSRAPSY